MMIRWSRIIAAALVVAALAGSAPARGDDLAGKGSIGFTLGAMRYTGGHDFTNGAAVRPMLRVSFKYVWENHLVSVLEGAYGWNHYGQGGDYTGPDSVGTIAVIVPVTIGLDYRFATKNPKIIPRVGAGAGLYAATIRSGRDHISKDPLTAIERRKTGPGFYGKVGTEIMALPAMAVNVDILYHQAFVKDATKFPSGWFTSNTSFAEIRVGLNYYFTIKQTGAAPSAPKGEGEE